MRLVTFSSGDGDGERMGAVLRDGSVLDLARAWDADPGGDPPATTGDLLRGGDAALRRARELVAAAEAGGGVNAPVLAADGLTWHAPFVPPRIFGIGLNYRSHAEEQGAKIPRNPIVFTKALSSLTGHGGAIVSPPDTEQLDYEAELAVVIGTPCAGVEAGEAMAHVLGYTCLNDVTARDIQRSDRQWHRSKSYPTFTPMGRELVTVDDAPPLQELVVSCVVSGEPRQSSPVTDLIFGVPELIAFLSRFTPLAPGDVIATGTPGGVGFVFDPPRFLSPGDVVTAEVSGVTALENPVTAG